MTGRKGEGDVQGLSEVYHFQGVDHRESLSLYFVLGVTAYCLYLVLVVYSSHKTSTNHDIVLDRIRLIRREENRSSSGPTLSLNYHSTEPWTLVVTVGPPMFRCFIFLEPRDFLKVSVLRSSL